jgi:hypothetical protein
MFALMIWRNRMKRVPSRSRLPLCGLAVVTEQTAACPPQAQPVRVLVFEAAVADGAGVRGDGEGVGGGVGVAGPGSGNTWSST